MSSENTSEDFSTSEVFSTTLHIQETIANCTQKYNKSRGVAPKDKNWGNHVSTSYRPTRNATGLNHKQTMKSVSFQYKSK